MCSTSAASSHSSERRWLDVGQADDRDSRLAGKRAADAALKGRSAALLIVFASDSHDLEQLLESINERSAGAPLIGCSTAGEIATDGPGDAGVVVTALGGDGFVVRTAVAENASERLRAAGAEAASCMTAVDEHPHRALLMLSDGLAGNQQEIVRGAYGVLGAEIPLVGGCAGDDLKMRRTYQLCDDRVLTNSVVAAGVASDGPLGIGVRHGWRKVGDPILVSESVNNLVYLLDEEPALDVYLDRLDAPADVRSNPSAFTNFALTHPLGLDRRTDEEQVRFIAEADFERRALVCIAEVPQGGIAWFMEGDEDSVLGATDAACHDALAHLNGFPTLGMIAFDCIARRGVLGDAGIQREIAQIAGHANGAPVAGFYTYGEIARTHGVSGFHNQTLVVLAVG